MGPNAQESLAKYEVRSGCAMEDKMNDLQMQRKVQNRLALNPSVDAAEIGVSVADGTITLSGTVKNFPEKWSAEQVALHASSAKRVDNRMIVNLPPDDERSDERLANLIFKVLDSNVLIPRNRVSFVLEDGRLTLKGNVDFHYQKFEAERAVRNFVGLKDVASEITVQKLASPKKVREKIERALELAADVDAEKLVVEVEGGAITLRGAVSTARERQMAEAAAAAVAGVTKVTNALEVKA